MFSSSKTNSVFERVIRTLVRKTDDKKLKNFLVSISNERCILAESDHIRDNRVYMHTLCEKHKEKENLVCFSSSTEHLSENNIFGLFCHEIGHLIAANRAELLENIEGISVDEDVGGSVIIGGVIVDEEILADYIMQELFGVRIFYDENKVQFVIFKT